MVRYSKVLVRYHFGMLNVPVTYLVFFHSFPLPQSHIWFGSHQPLLQLVPCREKKAASLGLDQIWVEQRVTILPTYFVNSRESKRLTTDILYFYDVYSMFSIYIYNIYIYIYIYIDIHINMWIYVSYIIIAYEM